ncbi:MAG: hypothetical protein AABX63_02030 [Nanoarchaeota archaeon]|mgnify:CR=1 FL=1
MTTVNIRRDNLSASTKTGNLLADTDLQQVAEESQISIYAISSAAGVNMEMGAGADKVISDREILFIGTSVDKSAHLVTDPFVVEGGTNLSLFLRETAAAATTDVLLIIEATPTGA